MLEVLVFKNERTRFVGHSNGGGKRESKQIYPRRGGLRQRHCRKERPQSREWGRPIWYVWKRDNSNRQSRSWGGSVPAKPTFRAIAFPQIRRYTWGLAVFDGNTQVSATWNALRSVRNNGLDFTWALVH